MATLRPRGFTLVELVVAVAIVGVLALLAAPMLEVTVQRQKEARLREALRQIRTAIDAYHDIVVEQRRGNVPRIEVAADASGYPPNLDVLVQGVRDLASPDGGKIYFLRSLPRDPFRPEPDLPASATWGKRAYASPPDAPEEGDDVYDVYSLSDRVGLDGVPYREW